MSNEHTKDDDSRPLLPPDCGIRYNTAPGEKKAAKRDGMCCGIRIRDVVFITIIVMCSMIVLKLGLDSLLLQIQEGEQLPWEIVIMSVGINGIVTICIALALYTEYVIFSYIALGVLFINLSRDTLITIEMIAHPEDIHAFASTAFYNLTFVTIRIGVTIVVCRFTYYLHRKWWRARQQRKKEATSTDATPKNETSDTPVETGTTPATTENAALASADVAQQNVTPATEST